MPLTILGIDPDTKKLSIVEAGSRRDASKFFTHTIPLPSVEHHQRAGFAFRGMSELIGNIIERDGVPPVIYMEAPAQGIGGPGATIPQVYVQGAVMAAAAEWDCKFYQVHNKSWKKRECGNGNIKKGDTPAVMKEVWPELYKSVRGQQDLVDAGFIYLFGRRHQNLLAQLLKRKAS